MESSLFGLKGLRSFFDRCSLAAGLRSLRVAEDGRAAKPRLRSCSRVARARHHPAIATFALIRQTRDPAFTVVPVILSEERREIHCRFRKLNSSVSVVEPAKDRIGHDVPEAARPDV